MDSRNNPAKILALIFGILGSVFLVLGIIFLYSYMRAKFDYALMIMSIVFTPMGALFSLAGATALIIHLSRKGKIKRLKRDGVCYDAEIVRIRENYNMRVNYQNPFIVECGYKDRRGKSYLVKSGNVWPGQMLTRREDIRARVWVNPEKPKDYFVEVYLASEERRENMRYDFDYR